MTRAVKRTAQSIKVRRDLAGESMRAKLFVALCEQSGLPAPETQWRFLSTRRFRFDFAFIGQRVAVECVGGVWNRGAHSRGKHQLSDMAKRNLAQLEGWRVFEFTPEQLLTSDAIDIVRRALTTAEEAA